MLQNRAIPALISLKQLNPRIPDLSQDGTHIDTEFTQWNTSSSAPRRLALLNNFGAAGSNAALIIEEAASAPVPADRVSNAFVVGVSAESEEALEKLRSAYIQRLDSGEHNVAALADLSYTSTARRQVHTYRLAVSGQTKEELVQGLKAAQIAYVNESRGKTVFLFSGQGGQYLGMGAHLYNTIPSFRQIVDECHAKLVSWGFSGVLSIIASCDGRDHQEADIQSFQSAVFVLEYALFTLWTSWGVFPDAVAGHRYVYFFFLSICVTS